MATKVRVTKKPATKVREKYVPREKMSSQDAIKSFSQLLGPFNVWSIWKGVMLRQNRRVAKSCKWWSRLSEKDQALCKEMSIALLESFWFWLKVNNIEITDGGGHGKPR